jgi:hypothetical protein
MPCLVACCLSAPAQLRAVWSQHRLQSAVASLECRKPCAHIDSPHLRVVLYIGEVGTDLDNVAPRRHSAAQQGIHGQLLSDFLDVNFFALLNGGLGWIDPGPTIPAWNCPFRAFS